MSSRRVFNNLSLLLSCSEEAPLPLGARCSCSGKPCKEGAHPELEAVWPLVLCMMVKDVPYCTDPWHLTMHIITTTVAALSSTEPTPL